MSRLVEPEVVEREDEARPQVRLRHVKVLGLFGTALALLTTLAALSVGLLFLFGTTVAAALAATLAWPLVFSPEFTRWVFGAEQISFWKLFVLFLAAGAILKLFRQMLGTKR